MNQLFLLILIKKKLGKTMISRWTQAYNQHPRDKNFVLTKWHFGHYVITGFIK